MNMAALWLIIAADIRHSPLKVPQSHASCLGIQTGAVLLGRLAVPVWTYEVTFENSGAFCQGLGVPALDARWGVPVPFQRQALTSTP